MSNSVVLMEREGRSTALDYTSTLVCSKRPNGAFALWLIEASDLGRLRHLVARRIGTPGEFIEAVLSVNEWTDLHLDYETIRDSLCVPLARLDPDFAHVVGIVVRNKLATSGPRAA